MTCPNCANDVATDAFFCARCSRFTPRPSLGSKANLFRRWLALVIDPLIGVLAWVLASALFGAISRDLGTAMAILFPVVYLVWFLTLLRNGLTPGKKLLGLQVVQHQSGNTPGFATMFLREIVGRFLSGLFLGLGYFWALFDKNGQAWHDKLAGTVVLDRRVQANVATARAEDARPGIVS